MPSDLKPTTREERERWKNGHKFQPTDQSFTILRLIADCERRLWQPFNPIRNDHPRGWILALVHKQPRTGRFQTTEDGFLVFWVTDGFEVPAAAVSHICELPDYSEILDAQD